MSKPGGATVVDWGAGRYERTAEMLLPAARVLVDTAAPRAGERVLDIGSGTGSAALLAAAAGAHVTALDPAARLLDVARTAAQQQGLEVVCRLGEAAKVPAPAASFDCVLSNFGIIFAPDPDAAVAEVARVLDARGRIGFTAWVPGGAVGALASAAQELVRAAISAPPAPPGFPWHDQAAVRDLFARHGMVAAVANHEELTFTASSPRAYLDAQREDHPLAVTAFQVLERQGQADEATRRLLEILDEHNEAEDGFRSTSTYVVHVVRAA